MILNVDEKKLSFLFFFFSSIRPLTIFGYYAEQMCKVASPEANCIYVFALWVYCSLKFSGGEQSQILNFMKLEWFRKFEDFFFKINHLTV